MYLPLGSDESFSPFAYVRDAVHAFILYLFAFYAYVCSGLLAQSMMHHAGMPGASEGKYLIGVGIGDVTGYAPPFPPGVLILV